MKGGREEGSKLQKHGHSIQIVRMKGGRRKEVNCKNMEGRTYYTNCKNEGREEVNCNITVT